MKRGGALLLMAGLVGASCGGKASGDSPGPPGTAGGASAGTGNTGGVVGYPPIVSCFGKGTRIATATGSAAIEDVKVGDRVQAFDLSSGRVVDGLVTETFVHAQQRVGVLHTTGGPLRVTANHPIYDAGQGRFVPAGSLSETFQSLELASNWSTALVTLAGFEPLNEEETVYNFTVANVHTYFAGGLLVHNKSRCGYPGDPGDCPCLPNECGGTTSVSSGGTAAGSGGTAAGSGGTAGGSGGAGAGGAATGGMADDAGSAGESFAGGAPSTGDAGTGGV